MFYLIHTVNDFHHFLMTIPYLGDVRPMFFYGIVFFTSFIESIPVLGTFAPGTLLLLLFGFISTHPAISLYVVIGAATFGGTLGDLAAYYLGKYGFKYVTKIGWLMKYAKLESGHAFFNRHGGKSILFARFIGPIRPIVPFFAGVVSMPMRKFLAWNISGSILWASIYTTLGYFFGANFRMFAVWASRAGVLAFVVIVVLIALYGWKEKKTQQVLDNLEASDTPIEPKV
ncbi:MAG: DedA family protein [Patescibacteria group bacterium]